MNITQENIDELNAVLKVKVVEQDYLPNVENAIKQHQRKAAMPGFRPGKVPTGMIRKMYGKSILVDEINKLLNDSLYNYISENKIEVLGNPLPKPGLIIDWDNQKEFEFLYEMGLSPKFVVELSDKDKFTYEVVKVDDELVNKYITDIAKRYGKIETADTSAEGDMLNGDFVEVDAAGNVVAGGIFKTSALFLDRVSDAATKKALIGLKKDDKVTVDAEKLGATVSEIATLLGTTKEEAEQLNGKKVQFTVKTISRLMAAPVDQELFDKIYGPDVVKNEEEFKTKVRAELAVMFVNDSDRKFYNAVVDYLMNKISFSLPNDFLKRWILAVNDKPVTPEQIDKEFDEYAKGLKWSLIENKIIKDNELKVSDEEVVDSTKRLILEQFGRYSQEIMPDDELNKTVQRVLANKDEAKKILDRLYGDKVMNLFKTKFTLQNKEVPYEEFFKA